MNSNSGYTVFETLGHGIKGIKRVEIRAGESITDEDGNQQEIPPYVSYITLDNRRLNFSLADFGVDPTWEQMLTLKKQVEAFAEESEPSEQG